MGYNSSFVLPRNAQRQDKVGAMEIGMEAMEATNKILDPRSAPNSRDPGHVFVCNASVCDLQCDAFLCPSQIFRPEGRLWGSIFCRWRETSLCGTQVLLDAIPREGPWEFKEYPGHDRVVTFANWPWKAMRHSGRAPNPFLVAGEVSLDKSRDYAGMSRQERQQGLLPSEGMLITALLETVQQFLTVAIEELELNHPRLQQVARGISWLFQCWGLAMAWLET